VRKGGATDWIPVEVMDDEIGFFGEGEGAFSREPIIFIWDGSKECGADFCWMYY